MAVRSAFKAIFGSFPIIAYVWIGLGIVSSILVIMSVVAPEWLELLIPLTIAVPMFSTTATGLEPLAIWIGYPLIFIALFSFYMLWRRR